MSELLTKIEEAVYDGDADLTGELVEQAIETGIKPMDIINDAGVKALDRVGEDFDNLVIFLPQLMLAGEAMKALVQKVNPHMESGFSGIKGKIVMGCAKGDMHDIGKNLVCTQLSANGFDVVDLGIDVSNNKFIEQAEALGADIIAMSSLLTTSQYYMEELVKRLIDDGKREKFRIIVGGGPVNSGYAEKIKADAYARTAYSAVKACKQLMEIKPLEKFISVND